MSSLYQRTVKVTTTASPQIVAIDYPGRVELLGLIVAASASNKTFSVIVYNRAFTADAVALSDVVKNGTHTQLNCTAPHRLKVGDTITVAATSVGGYNTTHVVTSVIGEADPYTKTYAVVTDQTFTATAVGGTLTLAIPAAEQPAYLVLPVTAATTGIVSWAPSEEAIYVNADAQVDTGFNRKIYLSLSAADTYTITIRSRTILCW